MRVVITGAAGRIGSEMVEELSGTHDLCLVDRCPIPGRASVVADLSRSRAAGRGQPRTGPRPPRWAETFQGADVVLHLAADARNLAPWQRVLHDNIQATWNVIEAAARHRVRRVVFASSNWAVKARERALAPACYTPGGPRIGSDIPPQPLYPYGLSKAFGELTGRMFVDEGQLGSFVAVRIGYYHPDPPEDENLRRLWIGARDLRSLLGCCVEAKFEGFHVVYGTSAQPTAPYDLSYTRRLLSWEPRQSP
jgi:nucleoside-diphosphate-sugar epimerase